MEASQGHVNARPTRVSAAEAIQPVANETRDRIITGLITLAPFVLLGLAAWQVWNEALRWHDLTVFAIVYVLTTGCAWRHLPAEFGVSQATAHRRFVAWTQAGLWRRLHRAVLDRLGEQAAIDWSRAVVDAASVRAKKGSLTGPNPVNPDALFMGLLRR